MDYLLNIKGLILDAFNRGYDFLVKSDDTTDLFCMDSCEPSLADLQDDSSSGYHFMTDSDDLFQFDHFDYLEDSPVRGLYDMTSIYYSSMHMDDSLSPTFHDDNICSGDSCWSKF